MRKFFLAAIVVLLTGCWGPATFDASSESAVKESTQKIVDALPDEKREDFQNALMYFSFGGESGLKSLMGAAMSGDSAKAATEAALIINLKTIDGLTGEQIIEKYKTKLEEDRIRREKENAEREREKAEREKVRALEKEARELLESNKFEDALARYKAMSEISSGLEAAEEGIDETTKAMEAFAEKVNYMEKVEITEFVAKRIDTYSKKEIPAARISLKNNGDRSLDEVKVIVYFQDKDGNTIYEEDFYPVLVTRYSLSGDNKPLKPGYITEMEKDKYYTLDSALSDWEEGKAIAKVVDIEFSK